MMQRVTFYPQFGELATPITEVLVVCRKCGDLETRTLTGHWSLEQLRADREQNDEDFFRKIGVEL